MGAAPNPTGYRLPAPSTSVLADVSMCDRGADVVLSFLYRNGGQKYQGELVFRKVRATRRRAELHCTVEQIEGTYDTLVEVNPSDWAEEVRADTNSQFQNQWILRHFRIYFDSAGCYEFLADSWERREIPTD